MTRRDAPWPMVRARRERGVVLLALLMAMALGGVALMAATDVAWLTRQREREQELLFVGDQYRKAILRYYVGAPPGTGRMLPAKLEDLLDDDRYPTPTHHLRRLYADPITGDTEWGELRIDGRIAGVYSKSEKQPLKQAGFALNEQQFAGKAMYREWVFVPRLPGRPGRPTPQPTDHLPTPGAPDFHRPTPKKP
jgi:type II secretory pathway pseudopilin PulG